MMNDEESFSRSKHNDNKLVDFFNSLNGNNKSYVGSEYEDKVLKVDIWLDGRWLGNDDGALVPVDTKYTDSRPITRMWYEADVKTRKSKKLLCCFSSALALVRGKDGKLKHKTYPGRFTRCFFVDVEWLDEHAEANRDKWYAGRVSGKKLVDFSILDVPREHVMEVDLSGVGLA